MNVVVKYLPMGLLSIYLGKLLFLGSNLADMGVVFSLSALSIASLYHENSKEFKELKEFMNKETKVIEALAKALDDVRTKQASMQISQGFRKVT